MNPPVPPKSPSFSTLPSPPRRWRCLLSSSCYLKRRCGALLPARGYLLLLPSPKPIIHTCLLYALKTFPCFLLFSALRRYFWKIEIELFGPNFGLLHRDARLCPHHCLRLQPPVFAPLKQRHCPEKPHSMAPVVATKRSTATTPLVGPRQRRCLVPRTPTGVYSQLSSRDPHVREIAARTFRASVV